MPPQFKTQFDPANKVPAPVNPPEDAHQGKTHGFGFLITLTFLLILTGIFGVWYFSNPVPEEETDGSTSLTTSKFADWKTYKNEEYGFEFKYPLDWRYKLIIRSDTGVLSVAFFPPGKDINLNTGYTGDILVDTFENQKQLSLIDFYKIQNVNLFEESVSQLPLNINGYVSEKFIGVYGEISTDIISINKNNLIIEFNDIGNNHSEDGIFDTMVNSFK